MGRWKRLEKVILFKERNPGEVESCKALNASTLDTLQVEAVMGSCGTESG